MSILRIAILAGIATLLAVVFIGCGDPKPPSGARLEVIIDPLTGTASYKCVDFIDPQECIELLEGLDGTNGEEGPQGEEGNNGSDGLDGVDGIDGVDGEDGEDAVLLTTKVLENGCHSIFPGLWAQNLDNGYVFDVYTNNTCEDTTGAEVCDNVATSYGSNDNPPVGNDQPGAAEVCWHENLMISGARLDGGDIFLYILEFTL